MTDLTNPAALADRLAAAHQATVWPQLWENQYRGRGPMRRTAPLPDTYTAIELARRSATRELAEHPEATPILPWDQPTPHPLITLLANAIDRVSITARFGDLPPETEPFRRNERLILYLPNENQEAWRGQEGTVTWLGADVGELELLMDDGNYLYINDFDQLRRPTT